MFGLWVEYYARFLSDDINMYASSHNNVMNFNASNYVLCPVEVRRTHVATCIKRSQVGCCRLVTSVGVTVPSCFDDLFLF